MYLTKLLVSLLGTFLFVNKDCLSVNLNDNPDFTSTGRLVFLRERKCYTVVEVYPT